MSVHFSLPLLLALVAGPLAVVGVAQAQAPPTPTLPPVVVESGRGIAERRRTEEEAREELQRVPGGADVVGRQSSNRAEPTSRTRSTSCRES